MGSTSSRRNFLRGAGVAGAAAAGGIALTGRSNAATGAAGAAAVVTAQTDTITGLQFDVIGGGKMSTATPSNGSIYPSVAAAQLVTALPLSPGRSLTSLKIFAVGSAALKISVLLHDVVRNGFVGGSPVAQVTLAPKAGAIVVPIAPGGVAVGEGQKLEVWVSGATAATPLSGLVYGSDVTPSSAPAPMTTTSALATTTTLAATTTAAATTIATTAATTTSPTAASTTVATTLPPNTVAPTTAPITAPITTAPPPPPLPASYGYRPMSPTSPWNTPIDAASTRWSDDPILHTINGITYNGTPDPQLHYWINTDLNGSCPVYHVQPNDPTWTFQLRNPWRGHDTTPFQLQAPATFRAGTIPNGDNPATLIIGNTLHDLYGIIMTSPNTATLYGYANQPLTTGTGFGTPGQHWNGGTWNLDPATGTRAANTPWGVGLISQDDLDATTITHALAIALPNRMLTSKAVPPATSYDNDNANTGTIACGTRLAIPPTTPMPTALADPKWNGLGTKFWNVLQTYGMYVVDGCGGAWPILYTDTNSVTNPTQLNPLYAFWNYPPDTNNHKQAILDHINPHLRIAT